MRIYNMFQALFEKIEFGLSSNWFNPLLTIYLNFRSFRLSQAVRLPVFVYGHPRIYSLRGSMVCIGKIRMGMVSINKVQFACPNNTATSTEICNRGKILFHGNAIIGTGNKIIVELYGRLELGDNIKITDCCNITVHKSVCIGAQSRIVHRCQVMDSNFHYIANFNKNIVPTTNRPIVIGEYCWICNSSTVTGGSVIPDKTIVASNSLVGKDYSSIPEESIIGGIPAKLIATGFRRVENKDLVRKLTSFFQENQQENIYNLENGISHSCCDL